MRTRGGSCWFTANTFVCQVDKRWLLVNTNCHLHRVYKHLVNEPVGISVNESLDLVN